MRFYRKMDIYPWERDTKNGFSKGFLIRNFCTFMYISSNTIVKIERIREKIVKTKTIFSIHYHIHSAFLITCKYMHDMKKEIFNTFF